MNRPKEYPTWSYALGVYGGFSVIVSIILLVLGLFGYSVLRNIGALL